MASLSLALPRDAPIIVDFFVELFQEFSGCCGNQKLFENFGGFPSFDCKKVFSRPEMGD